MISFSQLQESHLPLLYDWLMNPHVRQWWDSQVNWTMQSIHDKYIHYVNGYKRLTINSNVIYKPMHAFIVLLNSQPIGYIQYYNRYDFAPEQGYDLSFLPKSCAAIDFYIGEVSALRKGYGAKILQEFTKQFVSKNFENAFVDPENKNEVAIRCYQAAGFEILCTKNEITFLLKKL